MILLWCSRKTFLKYSLICAPNFLSPIVLSSTPALASSCDLISGEECMNSKERNKKRIDSWLWFIKIRISEGTVGSLEIHKMFKSRAFASGGLFHIYSAAISYLPLPEEPGRKWKEPKSGSSGFHQGTTPLFNTIHYSVRRKGQST